MLRHYIKQALQMLKENPLVNTISILGTALSIAVIMVLVLVFQINNAGYAPESNRSRMLYFPGISVKSDSGSGNGSGMSVETLKDCIYPLQIPEVTTAVAQMDLPVSIVGKQLYKRYKIIFTDPGFWKAFDFTYLHGNPFTDADFESGIYRAVISESLSLKLLGTTDGVGQTILVDDMLYSICGVVKTVSRAAVTAYAEVWVPYTTSSEAMKINNNYAEGITGPLSPVILARNHSDFPRIKEELNGLVQQFNSNKTDWEMDLLESPLTQAEIGRGSKFDKKVPLSNYLLTTGAILLFLLLVPALNLIGVVQSSVQKRGSEVGVRKAFGATWDKLMSQVLIENMVTTLLGGLLGFVLSFVLLMLGKSILLTDATLITADMLIRPGLFLALLLLAFLLNLFSAGIPARRMAKQQIVDALKETHNK